MDKQTENGQTGASLDPIVTRDISKVFNDKQGNSIAFQIDAEEPDKDHLVQLVKQGGGVVDPLAGVIISSTTQSGHQTYKPEYLYDAVRGDGVVDMKDYLNSSLQENPEQPSVVDSSVAALVSAPSMEKPSNNKTGFSVEEDEIILEYVRKRPSQRTSHKLYSEIAIKLGRHTGNSVRYRYRNHLASKLQYVYNTNPQGDLVLDSNGEPVKVFELPKTLKNKFTAEEDYNLCKEVYNCMVMKGDTRENGETVGRVTVPSSLFVTMQQKYPLHTKSAWRDRYRKFALIFGVTKYITYYEESLSHGAKPEPMKNCTAKGFPLKDKGPHTPLDDEIGESQRPDANPDVNGAIINSTLPFKELPDASNLFEARFYQIPQSQLIGKIKYLVENSYANEGGAQMLIEKLYSEIGLSKEFGRSIIYSVCGDVALIPTYIEESLKTGKNPPKDYPGIWNSEHDGYLTSGKDELFNKLIALHGLTRVRMRREFLEMLEDES